MGQLLVRDLDDEVIRRLKARAARNGRSTEAEHRAILEAAMRPSREELIAQARRFRDETRGRGGPTGVEIIRQLRDGTLEIP